MDSPTPVPTVKQCSGCKQRLPVASFHKNNRYASGLDARCKACASAYQAQWRAENRDRVNARARRYRVENQERIAAQREANREATRAYHRRRYAENRESFREYQNRWYAAHSVAYRESRRRWYAENREHHNERSRRHYDANKASYHARSRDWERSHPGWTAEQQRRRRARKQATPGTNVTLDLLVGKLAYWGGHCWMCGGEPEAWDHVKPLSKGGAHVLANLRPACKSCNSSKGVRWFGPARLTAVLPRRTVA